MTNVTMINSCIGNELSLLCELLSDVVIGDGLLDSSIVFCSYDWSDGNWSSSTFTDGLSTSFNFIKYISSLLRPNQHRSRPRLLFSRSDKVICLFFHFGWLFNSFFVQFRAVWWKENQSLVSFWLYRLYVDSTL